MAAQQEIDLLREYHSRLISDIVTGKLDVRTAALQLPDDDAYSHSVKVSEERIVDQEVTV